MGDMKNKDGGFNPWFNGILWLFNGIWLVV